MRKYISFLIAFMFITSFFTVSVNAVETPPADYSSIFQNKVIPVSRFENKEYFIIFYDFSERTNKYCVLSSDTEIVFRSSQNSSFSVQANTSKSSDSIVWTDSTLSTWYLSCITTSNLNTDNIIYYCNHDIYFENTSGDRFDFYLKKSESKFFEYFDYYNNTNYSETYTTSSSSQESETSEVSEEPAWYDVAGWASKIFNSVANFFNNFRNNLHNVFDSFFNSVNDFFSGFENLLHDLFVPAERFYEEYDFQQLIVDKLSEKFEFISSIRNFIELISNTHGQTLYYEFTFFNRKFEIDFSWYEPYRLTVRSSFSALFITYTFLKVFKMFSNIFGIDNSDSSQIITVEKR